jgi:hypothetical protein
MKKLLTIATLLILTTSCIQSADWISDHLPKNWQVDPIWPKQVKLIQEKTGTATPIVFMAENDDSKNKAAVINVGAGPCRVAFMFINQASFQRDSFDQNIKTLAHETVHVDQNHNGIKNTAFFTGLGMVSSSPLLKIAQLATSTPLRAGRTFALGLSFSATGLLYPRDKKSIEHEADKKSFEKLKQLELCDTLENLSKYYRTQSENYEILCKLLEINDAPPLQFSPNYPTY